MDTEMETCDYSPVDKNEELHQINEYKESKAPFFRQLLICSGLWTTYFATGLCLGAPTVVIAQLRDGGVDVSRELASWLSSAFIYSAMPWVVILPIMTRFFGRKPPLMFACIMSVVSFGVLYVGQTVWTFLIGQIIQGILMGSNLTVSIILLTENTSPQYRGIFMTIKSASVFWGVWASNAIGTFLHWNHIGSFGLLCCIYYLTLFVCPESPTYLAMRGKFEECKKAHRWLKGTGKKAELELEELINAKIILDKECNDVIRHSISKTFKNIYETVILKVFYKPILISALVVAQHHSAGKLVCSMYSIELITNITGSKSTAYIGMLILDGVSVLGMYVGCAMSKFLKRRTLLLSTSAVGIFFLFLISIYLWMVKYSVFTENKIVTVSLLAAFSIAISCGPMILSMSIYAELLPLRFKNAGVIITILLNFGLMGTSIKLAPFMFETLKLYGTFGLYGILASFFTFLLYKYLPETKDRTLLEIEEYFKDNIN